MRVIGYHLILTCYGFWLPNDPRGSWSDFVRAWELQRFGPATKTSNPRSHAHDTHDIRRRLEAKKHLARPDVHLTGLQARAVATGFGRFVRRSGIEIWACAVLPSHAHLVIKRHHYPIEEIAKHLKGRATTQLKREGLHPFEDDPYTNGSLPSPWARKEWKCFLFDESYARNAIRYVERNPTRERYRAQNWTFVTPFTA